MANRKTTVGNRDGSHTRKLVRTSVLIYEDTHAALLAKAEAARRPITWEIRDAIEAHVEPTKAAA